VDETDKGDDNKVKSKRV